MERKMVTLLSEIIVAGETDAKPKCPTHDVLLDRVNGRYGVFYSCPNYPECDTCGQKSEHDGRWRTSTQTMRTARNRAHEAFDRLWKSRVMSRNGAYRWLAEAMGLHKQDCHIQHMTEKGCEMVVELSNLQFAAIADAAAAKLSKGASK
jgi:ssDNA-binding Zn-finger/Zn-ribbon topoisomerase 1